MASTMADISVQKIVRAVTASGMKTRPGGRQEGARGRIVSAICPDKAIRDRMASALAKAARLALIRIDLSQVVSKYFAETEKSLDRVLERAEGVASLLWFDEAYALFERGSGVRDAHDRYANQEVAYLLQRIEAFDGLVVLASNRRQDIDGSVDLIAECG